MQNASTLKPKDPIVPPAQLSAELNKSTVTLWRWRKSGYLPPVVHLGGSIGWPRSVIDSWKTERGWPAPEQNETGSAA